MKKIILILLFISSCYSDGKLSMNQRGQPIYFYSDRTNSFMGIKTGELLYGVPVRDVDSTWCIVYSCGYIWRIRRDSIFNKSKVHAEIDSIHVHVVPQEIY